MEEDAFLPLNHCSSSLSFGVEDKAVIGELRDLGSNPRCALGKYKSKPHTTAHSRMAKKQRQTMTSVDKDIGKLDPSCTAAGM